VPSGAFEGYPDTSVEEIVARIGRLDGPRRSTPPAGPRVHLIDQRQETARWRRS
jgi:hypothetical protein